MLKMGIALAALTINACDQHEPHDSNDAGSGTRLIDGDPICPDCQINFRHVATLGSEADPASVWEGAAGSECMVAQLSTGKFVLGGVASRGDVFMYDDQGRFIRSISRQGQGPGELTSRARILVSAGDTLWVADDGNVRMQVWTAAGQHIRSFSMPAPYRAFTRLNRGDIVFDGPVDRTGDPMYYVLSPLGEELDRVGESKSREVDLEWSVLARRRGPGGGFWASSIWHYAIEHWDSGGSLSGTLVRDAAWFPPYPPYPDEVFDSEPPPPGMYHIREDTQGRLWAFVLLPDADWRPEIPRRPRHTWNRETFDYLVEVIDPALARLIARDIHDDRVAPMCNSPLVYTVVEAPSGDLRVRVMEPQIVDANGEPWG